MDVAAIAILAVALVGGVLLAGRWVKSVPLQLLIGAALGVGMVFVLVASLLGIAFAGCLLMSAKSSFH